MHVCIGWHHRRHRVHYWLVRHGSDNDLLAFVTLSKIAPQETLTRNARTCSSSSKVGTSSPNTMVAGKDWGILSSWKRAEVASEEAASWRKAVATSKKAGPSVVPVS